MNRYPTLIAVAPICLCFLPLVVEEYGLLSGLPVTLVSGLGLGLLMDQVGRDMGRKKQSRLFGKWGGMPTTVYLRHKDAHINPVSKSRYHTILTGLLPDLALPSKEQERKDPDQADAIYSSCADFLRERTRDKDRFPLVFQENCNYGFRRNLWCMRPIGTTLAVLGTLACFMILVCNIKTGQNFSIALICFTINAPLAFLWLFRFNPDWVQIAADAYARRLLEACDSFAAKNKFIIRTDELLKD